MTGPCAQGQTYPNLTYATVGGTPLLLDLYLPATGSGPFPVVVWIHGGGWSGGGRFPAGFSGPLTAAGFAVASVEYRLTSQAGQYGAEPVIFPAQIHDVKGAVRWLRAHAATYNLDPTRFGCWGTSAGGHLSALLATSSGVAALEGTVGGNAGFSSAVQACADYFGPTDLLNMNPDVITPPGSGLDHDAPGSPESHLIGFDDPGQGIGVLRANQANPTPPYPALMTLVTQANPITWVGPADPPFFIAHGELDATVPQKQSVKLKDALSAAGISNQYWVVPNNGHGFGGAAGTATSNATIAFFRQVLQGAPPPGPLAGCWANCDASTVPPALNVNDYQCFLNRYGAGLPMANCDGSTLVPVLNVNDFACFTYSIRCWLPLNCAEIARG
jgi:acetyl esterase/lipase